MRWIESNIEYLFIWNIRSSSYFNTLLTGHELTQLFALALAILIFDIQSNTGYYEIFFRRIQSCSFYHKKKLLFWYLDFYRNFSVTKISIMTDRDGEVFFNELYADVLSDCQSDFKIWYIAYDILLMWKLIVWSENSYELVIRPRKRQICKTCCVHVGGCYTVCHTKQNY